MTLTEEWSEPGDELAVGIPRTRTIVVEGLGLLETQLPDVPLETQPGVRQYADRPELSREITPEGLASRRSVSYAVIAQTPGELTLERRALAVVERDGTALGGRRAAAASSAREPEHRRRHRSAPLPSLPRRRRALRRASATFGRGSAASWRLLGSRRSRCGGADALESRGLPPRGRSRKRSRRRNRPCARFCVTSTARAPSAIRLQRGLRCSPLPSCGSPPVRRAASERWPRCCRTPSRARCSRSRRTSTARPPGVWRGEGSKRPRSDLEGAGLGPSPPRPSRCCRCIDEKPSRL